MSSVLDQIVAQTHREIAQRISDDRVDDELARLSRRAATLGAANSLSAAIRASRARCRLAVIAEVKRRSTSAGIIAADVDPAVQAGRYVSGGCAAISVLTNTSHFGGSLDDLRAVRAVTASVPLLRKDFVVHELQLLEARCAGADVVLLIERVLRSNQTSLAALLQHAQALGLEALVEVDSRDGLDHALAAGASIVGVNNRDLATFTVDLARTEQIAAHVPSSCLLVAESGIETPADARRMRDAGASALLVGSALMRSEDPATLIGAL